MMNAPSICILLDFVWGPAPVTCGGGGVPDRVGLRKTDQIDKITFDHKIAFIVRDLQTTMTSSSCADAARLRSGDICAVSMFGIFVSFAENGALAHEVHLFDSNGIRCSLASI